MSRHRVKAASRALVTAARPSVGIQSPVSDPHISVVSPYRNYLSLQYEHPPGCFPEVNLSQTTKFMPTSFLGDILSKLKCDKEAEATFCQGINSYLGLHMPSVLPKTCKSFPTSLLYLICLLYQCKALG